MKNLLLLGLTILLSGCTGLDFEKIYLRSYVMYYRGIEEIRIYSVYKDSATYPDKLLIGVHGCLTHSDDGDANYYDSNPSVYDALCRKHNDMTFNRKLKINVADHRPAYPSVDFVSMEVVSDADYDASHPSGSLLNDLITVNYYSARPYIDSGYREYDKEIGLIKYSEIVKPLADVSADELTLLGSGDYYQIYGDNDSYNYFDFPILIFESEPTLSKTHTFTVTMTADDGRVFSESIEVTFE